MPELFDWDNALREWRCQLADDWLIIRQDGTGVRLMIGTYIGAAPLDRFNGLWLALNRDAWNTLERVLMDLARIQLLYDTTGSIAPVET